MQDIKKLQQTIKVMGDDIDYLDGKELSLRFTKILYHLMLR